MPYYYFNAGNAGVLHGTRVGIALQIAEIKGRVFVDSNVDGIYNASDIPLASKPVRLYVYSGSNYVFLTGTTTTATGMYVFPGL
jgi:hypothetical protein